MELVGTGTFSRTIEADSDALSEYVLVFQEQRRVYVTPHGWVEVVGYSLPFTCDGVSMIQVDFSR
jgi:hypothetical protein